MAYTKYSLTPANNNAAPPDGAPEGMLPSAVNDTMRDMMAQIRDCGDGIRGGTYTMTAPVITGGSISGASVSATSLTDSGNITFTGTGNRITGDLTNATVASRVLFQTSTANSGTFVGVVANGTVADNTGTGFNAFANSDTTASQSVSLLCFKNLESRLTSGSNTGTYSPLTIYTGGSERLRIDTSGNVGIGTSSPQAKLHTAGAMLSSGALVALSASSIFVDQTTSALSRIGIVGADAATVGTLTVSQYSSNGAVGRDVLKIDSSGNVGIGTTSPSGASGKVLEINGGSGQARLVLKNDATGSASTDGSQIALVSSQLVIQNREASEITFETNGSERMRINSSGDLLVGTTNENINAGVGAKFRTSATTPYMGYVTASSSNADTNYHVYSTGAGAYRFYVGSGGTIYATSTTVSAISDQRFKENIVDLDAGLDSVMALKPRKFDWKVGKGKDIKNDRGFIAQEFEQVFPDLIDKWKDPAPEGEEPYKSVRADLIPVLVKAIQELKAQVDAQALEIQALKAK